MCGLVGIVTSHQHPLSPDPIGPEGSRSVIEAMRDRLAHRGPDDAGLWLGDHAALGHRRLAILDPSPAGHQPFCLRPNGPVLLYNGELYNDDRLRSALDVPFTTTCDTETLWHALDRWGADAVDRLRGMYAFAWYDPKQAKLILARDPMGIKPMYVWEGCIDSGPHESCPVVAFASEIPALFEHPGINPEPDHIGISAYLTTIRTVNGSRTMFAGVRALLPGEVVEYDLNASTPTMLTTRRVSAHTWPVDGTFAEVFEDSVHRHLRSDVPLCALLSGGLDSSAICAVARPQLDELHTYCAGAPDQAAIAGVPQSDDLPVSKLVAEHLDTRHSSITLDQDLFVRTWQSMVAQLGVPLSTPNETAIHLLCAAMRNDGRKVTLSGEGADELLGGYEAPMAAATAHIVSGDQDPGMFQLESNAWCPLELKPNLLTPEAWNSAQGDQWLTDFYRTTFESCRVESSAPLAAHLRFHREVNLTGLLGRLDSASMLASVEGRTPFADVAFASCAESLPMSERYAPDSLLRTKIALRRAFADRLPESIVARPKASFPLPFQHWMAPMADRAMTCSWINTIIPSETLALICNDPATHWRLAWPILNLAMWGEQWWGKGGGGDSVRGEQSACLEHLA